MAAPDSPTELSSWGDLTARVDAEQGVHLRDRFSSDPRRADTMSVTVGDLYIDYSKQRVGPATMTALLALADQAAVAARRDAMLAGESINTTEDRAVLHTALRARRDEVIEVGGVDVVPGVHEVLDRMAALTAAVHEGVWRGATGEPITTVVNLGIGGSHLGPAMAYEALRPYRRPGIDVRFVSNVDGADLVANLAGLDPASTLFIVCSKSFTTIETLTNAIEARRWVEAALGPDAVAAHFVAASTNTEAVASFGIDTENMFEFWDWVGGRYSLASAVGLSLMLGIGEAHFRELLGGMATVDNHFAIAPASHNGPLLLGLLGVWNRDFLGASTHAVLPYSHDLRLLPDYLQQLDMESNGKSTTLDGNPVHWATGPVVWGTAGTNGQHAYYQLIHQGTELIPADLIGFVRPNHELTGHHDQLMANLFAQAEALAFGRTETELDDSIPAAQRPHRTFAGNQPTTTILAPELSPSVLGQLIALYEHKVFVQGAIWRVNSFDQWGVELGKQLATKLMAEIDSADVGPHDSSTEALVRHYLSLRTA